MAGESVRRLAENEAVFRGLNERIEDGREPRSEEERVAFLCECARPGCSTVLELSVHEYEEIRGDPRSFVLARGHVDPAVEVVVREAADYVVVEKIGVAGEIVEELDPRS